MAEENKLNLDEIPKKFRDNIESELDRAKLEKEIEVDLRTNPRYKDYFSKFKDFWVEDFIKGYPFKKAMWIKYGKFYCDEEEKRHFRYSTLAESCMWQIQQKKLFDLQCRWRAEEIIIPEIKVTWDFNTWGNNIMNCNFIEPITYDEIELYREYLNSDDFQTDLLDYFSDWQDYEEYKESELKDDDESILPEWYEFYNMRKGTGDLLTLPDIRGNKESFYTEIYHNDSRIKQEEEKQKKIREGTYVEPLNDNRPTLSIYNSEQLDEFVNLFEDEKIKRFFRAYESSTTFGDSYSEDIEEAVNTLLEADEKIPIEGWHDWREGLIRTARKYERKKISECLDEVHNAYLQRRELGISYELPDKKFNLSFVNAMTEQIIKGRILNGEPGDLNF